MFGTLRKLGLFTKSNLFYSGIPNLTAYPDTSSDPPFSNQMRYTNRRRRVARPRMMSRRPPRTLRMRDSRVLQFTRNSGPYNNALVVGLKGTVTDITLSLVPTSDLIGTFDLYRIKKVVAIFTPVTDPANSGVVNIANLLHYCACDPTGQITSTTYPNVASFGNSKMVTTSAGTGSAFYTFYPKAVNSVTSGGVGTAVGSYETNPWLFCTSAGVSVPHQRFLAFTTSINALSTQSFSLVYRITFECKNIF